MHRSHRKLIQNTFCGTNSTTPSSQRARPCPPTYGASRTRTCPSPPTGPSCRWPPTNSKKTRSCQHCLSEKILISLADPSTGPLTTDLKSYQSVELQDPPSCFGSEYAPSLCVFSPTIRGSSGSKRRFFKAALFLRIYAHRLASILFKWSNMYMY